MKNAFTVARSKVVAVGTALMLVGTSALADIPAAVDTELTAIVTDATAMQGKVLPIVVTVVGLAIVIKLVRRFMNKI